MTAPVTCSKCGHIEGDHRIVRTPIGLVVGVCLVGGCGCKEFTPDA